MVSSDQCCAASAADDLSVTEIDAFVLRPGNCDSRATDEFADQAGSKQV